MAAAVRQTGRALRALSPKRGKHPRPASDDETDGGASPEARSGSGSPSFISLTGRVSSRSRYLSRRRRAAQMPQELPELEKSDADFYKEWGMSREREEILLSEFRKQLEEETGGPLKPMFDRYYLRRFLRARQHDLKRAKAMFLAHLKWREENGIDTILTDFQFPERDAFLALYPQGYHKTDKLGRPVYIQHIGAIKIKQLAEITTEDRMIRYNVKEYERCLKYIFPSCSKKAGRHIDTTLAIMDVKGVGLKHLTGDVKSILNKITDISQNNYPETLGKTVIINAPTVFKMIWAVVRPMLDVRTQGKIEVAPSDYMKVLLRYIDEDCIPEYLGGKSKGSLIDDVGPWKDPAILALVEADIARRERQGEEGGVLSGDSMSASMDLERGSLTGDLTPHAPPSPLASAAAASTAAAAAQPGQQQLAAAAPAGAQARSSGALPESPFVQTASGGLPPRPQQQASPVTSSSEQDEFQDARSRRQSILSSGSSAYMSAGEEDSDFFTPKGSEVAQPSGVSFHSDRPLLSASVPASPEGKLPAVAGVAAAPPPPSQMQQQQQQAAGGAAVKYSDQYPPSSPEDQAAARRGGRPQLAVVVPAESGTSDQEPSLAAGMSPQAAFATPGSAAWSTGKQQQRAGDGMPSPPLQIPILARVRALEEKLPEAERGVRRYLPPGGELPSKAVGQGTLLSRVEALERAMDTLLRAQDTALDQQRRASEEASRGCSGCCTIM